MERIERVPASLTDERRYRLLVEAVTGYAIFMLDVDGLVTSWSPGARRISGYEASDILSRHFSNFYTEEDREAGLPARSLDTAIREGTFEGEGWRVRKDGSRFWAHVDIDPVRTPSGDIVGFAMVMRDLTERNIAGETLKRSEEQFKLLVQGVTDYSLYMIDLDGRVSSWNLGAQRIKGYSADEIIGKHFSRFYTEEDRENGEPAKALETAAREGRFEKEAIRVRKDGTRFWANVVIDAIRDASGALIGYAKITRDVTERVEAQRALEQAREALFQSQKMDAIGQLTGGIAHDFNNLLTAVLGSLELARKRLADDPKTKALIDNAIQGALRGTSLTHRMLAFARRQDLNPEPIDVRRLVQGMTDLLQTSLGSSISLETRFPVTLPLAHVDANQLELAFLNLAVNGRDAMPTGGCLTIAAREESVTSGHSTGLKAGRYVCLSVTDRGEGMDEATLARAVEPFFTTKEVGKGTGLGLPMVHGLAEQSGGRLILKSRKGAGTTAELWLPMASQAADVEPQHQSASHDTAPDKHRVVGTSCGRR
jgi:PAS domain S-box-containing protein